MNRILIAGLALVLAGCLEREETIVVGADGGVTITHRLKGDAAEFREGRVDALPSGKDTATKRDDGGTEVVREATATYAAGEALPASFGDAAALQFPTTVTVGMGSWVFERRYVGRRYAWRDRIFRRWFPQELQKALERKEEGATKQALAALIEFEKERIGTLLEEAMGAGASTRARLDARAAVAKAIAGEWTVERLEGWLASSQEDQARLDAKHREWSLGEAARAGAAALGDARLEAKVGAEFARLRRIYDATEDLQDESFVVRVTMPAAIKGADDRGEISEDGRTVTFRFKGEDLRDADLVLRVVAE